MEKKYPSSTKVVVVGGGVIGCSVAYHLTKFGWKDVVLLERDQLTSGTTWHAAGLVSQLGPTAAVTKIRKYTLDLYKKLEQEVDHSAGLRLNGALSIAQTDSRWQELQRQATTAQLYDVKISILDKDAIKKGLANNAESAEKSEKRWQQLQAWAYGKGISKALVYDGLFNFTKQSRLRGDELFIVSHKTEFSNFDPSVNLRRSALDTLGQRGFFKSIIQGGLGFSLQDIFFASSLDEKVKTIRELKLTHFIDDLSKVIFHPDFPQATMGILFEPGVKEGSEEKRIFRTWDDAEEFFSLSSWFKAELTSSLDFLCPLPSSGNNRVCKIRMENGEKYAVKKYLQLSKDSRPRLKAEFGHLSALWQLGYRNIPKPILRDESRAVYSLIEGLKNQKMFLCFPNPFHEFFFVITKFSWHFSNGDARDISKITRSILQPENKQKQRLPPITAFFFKNVVAYRFV